MINFTEFERIELKQAIFKKHIIVDSHVYSVFGKRIFDLLIASFLIVFILIWLIPLLGIIIKLVSPGPILFMQKRTGKNGQPFKCIKLRTMQHNITGKFQQATQNDPRITSIGKILRKTNLDELPQLINVLVGDMSIVGPRPHAVQHDAQYWELLPDYEERYLVKPGITGLAQVRGYRGETPLLINMKHRVRLDKWYIGNYSLNFDLLICWWTVKKMFLGDNNAW